MNLEKGNANLIECKKTEQKQDIANDFILYRAHTSDVCVISKSFNDMRNKI